MSLALLVILFLLITLIISSNKIIKVFIYIETLTFIFIFYLVYFNIRYPLIFGVLIILVLESVILILRLLRACFLWKSIAT